MTTSAAILRTTAILLAAGLGLVGCSSDTTENQSGGAGGGSDDLSRTEAPEATAQELALAQTLEADFEVTATRTMEDQWPDFASMASALAGTEDPDLCQEAGSAQYGLFINSKPANVRASIAEEALLDDNASAETVHAFYANDEASADRLQEVHENTDTACVEGDDSVVDHAVTTQNVDGQDLDVHTWQIVVSEQLTGRMIDVVGDEIYVRYAAAYPPQVMTAELDDDGAAFNEHATERALAVFEAAQAQ